MKGMFDNISFGESENDELQMYIMQWKAKNYIFALWFDKNDTPTWTSAHIGNDDLCDYGTIPLSTLKKMKEWLDYSIQWMESQNLDGSTEATREDTT